LLTNKQINTDRKKNDETRKLVTTEKMQNTKIYLEN